MWKCLKYMYKKYIRGRFFIFFNFSLLSLLFILYFFNMTRTLPSDVQHSIKSLLLRNTLLCSIKKMYLTVGMATLNKCRREFWGGGSPSIYWWKSGKSSKVSTSATQQYIAGMVWNGSLEDPRGLKEYLYSINISMSLSGAEKLLKGMELKARRKSKTNFVSAANKKLRLLAWDGKHRQ